VIVGDAAPVLLSDLVQHFLEMVEKLERCRRAVPPQGMAPHLVKRRRHIANQIAIASFLKATGCNELAIPFGELAAVLSELDKGRLDRVLEQAKAGSGRSVDRFDIYLVRATVVEALECLIRAGQEEKEAARYIAHNFPIFKRLLVGRKPRKRVTDPVRKLDYLAMPIIAWHKSFLGGTVKDLAAQQAFTGNHPAFLNIFEGLDARGCKAFANALLSGAAQRAKALTVSSELAEWADRPATEANLH
jgi:hypothetical protein